MRVISQNGKSDIPYEYFTFSIVGNGNGYSIIATKNIAEPPEVIMNSIFATYSTEEKAIKAMKILRETYAGMPIMMQNVELTVGEIKAIERIKKSGIMVRLVDEPSKVECFNNIIFQFPQDSEV